VSTGLNPVTGLSGISQKKSEEILKSNRCLSSEVETNHVSNDECGRTLSGKRSPRHTDLRATVIQEKEEECNETTGKV
jgi:hypothetical protein